MRYPVTPDGRYFVVRRRLWRMTNPNLDEAERLRLSQTLMRARRAIRTAQLEGDEMAAASARTNVDRLKRELGERGDPWWTDGAPDYNRHMVRNTPYAGWFASLEAGSQRFPARARRPRKSSSA